MWWTKTATTIEKPKQERKVIDYNWFPRTSNGDGWLIPEKLEHSMFLLEEELTGLGRFTYRDLALRSLNILLERGWLPPDMTKEEVAEMYKKIRPDK